MLHEFLDVFSNNNNRLLVCRVIFFTESTAQQYHESWIVPFDIGARKKQKQSYKCKQSSALRKLCATQIQNAYMHNYAIAIDVGRKLLFFIRIGNQLENFLCAWKLCPSLFTFAWNLMSTLYRVLRRHLKWFDYARTIFFRVVLCHKFVRRVVHLICNSLEILMIKRHTTHLFRVKNCSNHLKV